MLDAHWRYLVELVELFEILAACDVLFGRLLVQLVQRDMGVLERVDRPPKVKGDVIHQETFKLPLEP